MSTNDDEGTITIYREEVSSGGGSAASSHSSQRHARPLSAPLMPLTFVPSEGATVGDLKRLVADRTGIAPHRQEYLRAFPNAAGVVTAGVRPVLRRNGQSLGLALDGLEGSRRYRSFVLCGGMGGNPTQPPANARGDPGSITIYREEAVGVRSDGALHSTRRTGVPLTFVCFWGAKVGDLKRFVAHQTGVPTDLQEYYRADPGIGGNMIVGSGRLVLRRDDQVLCSESTTRAASQSFVMRQGQLQPPARPCRKPVRYNLSLQVYQEVIDSCGNIDMPYLGYLKFTGTDTVADLKHHVVKRSRIPLEWQEFRLMVRQSSRKNGGVPAVREFSPHPVLGNDEQNLEEALDKAVGNDDKKYCRSQLLVRTVPNAEEVRFTHAVTAEDRLAEGRARAIDPEQVGNGKERQGSMDNTNAGDSAGKKSSAIKEEDSSGDSEKVRVQDSSCQDESHSLGQQSSLQNEEGPCVVAPTKAKGIEDSSSKEARDDQSNDDGLGGVGATNESVDDICAHDNDLTKAVGPLPVEEVQDQLLHRSDSSLSLSTQQTLLSANVAGKGTGTPPSQATKVVKKVASTVGEKVHTTADKEHVLDTLGENGESEVKQFGSTKETPDSMDKTNRSNELQSDELRTISNEEERRSEVQSQATRVEEPPSKKSYDRGRYRSFVLRDGDVEGTPMRPPANACGNPGSITIYREDAAGVRSDGASHSTRRTGVPLTFACFLGAKVGDLKRFVEQQVGVPTDRQEYYRADPGIGGNMIAGGSRRVLCHDDQVLCSESTAPAASRSFVMRQGRLQPPARSCWKPDSRWHSLKVYREVIDSLGNVNTPLMYSSSFVCTATVGDLKHLIAKKTRIPLKWQEYRLMVRQRTGKNGGVPAVWEFSPHPVLGNDEQNLEEALVEAVGDGKKYCRRQILVRTVPNEEEVKCTRAVSAEERLAEGRAGAIDPEQVGDGKETPGSTDNTNARDSVGKKNSGIKEEGSSGDTESIGVQDSFCRNELHSRDEPSSVRNEEGPQVVEPAQAIGIEDPSKDSSVDQSNDNVLGGVKLTNESVDEICAHDNNLTEAAGPLPVEEVQDQLLHRSDSSLSHSLQQTLLSANVAGKGTGTSPSQATKVVKKVASTVGEKVHTIADKEHVLDTLGENRESDVTELGSTKGTPDSMDKTNPGNESQSDELRTISNGKERHSEVQSQATRVEEPPSKKSYDRGKTQGLVKESNNRSFVMRDGRMQPPAKSRQRRKRRKLMVYQEVIDSLGNINTPLVYHSEFTGTATVGDLKHRIAKKTRTPLEWQEYRLMVRQRTGKNGGVPAVREFSPHPVLGNDEQNLEEAIDEAAGDHKKYCRTQILVRTVPNEEEVRSTRAVSAEERLAEGRAGAIDPEQVGNGKETLGSTDNTNAGDSAGKKSSAINEEDSNGDSEKIRVQGSSCQDESHALGQQNSLQNEEGPCVVAPTKAMGIEDSSSKEARDDQSNDDRLGGVGATNESVDDICAHDNNLTEAAGPLPAEEVQDQLLHRSDSSLSLLTQQTLLSTNVARKGTGTPPSQATKVVKEVASTVGEKVHTIADKEHVLDTLGKNRESDVTELGSTKGTPDSMDKTNPSNESQSDELRTISNGKERHSEVQSQATRVEEPPSKKSYDRGKTQGLVEESNNRCHHSNRADILEPPQKRSRKNGARGAPSAPSGCSDKCEKASSVLIGTTFYVEVFREVPASRGNGSLSLVGTFEFERPDTTTVADLKRVVAQKTGIPAEQQEYRCVRLEGKQRRADNVRLELADDKVLYHAVNGIAESCSIPGAVVLNMPPVQSSSKGSASANVAEAARELGSPEMNGSRRARKDGSNLSRDETMPISRRIDEWTRNDKSCVPNETNENSQTQSSAPHNSGMHKWLQSLDAEGGWTGRFEHYAPAFEREFACVDHLILAVDSFGIQRVLEKCGVVALGDTVFLERVISKLPRPA